MKAVILALALSCAGAFAPVNKAAVRAPVELEAKKSVADLSEADLKSRARATHRRTQQKAPVVFSLPQPYAWFSGLLKTACSDPSSIRSEGGLWRV